MQARLRARALDAGVGMIAPETVFLSHDTVLEADVADRPLCRLRPRRHGAQRRGDQSPFPSRRRRRRHGRDRRPVSRGFVPAPCSSENVHIGNFVEVKNARVGTGRQGQSPHLSRRCAGRRRRQYRRGHDHLQLRRLRQASHRHRRGRLHRLELVAGRAGQDRRWRLYRRGLGVINGDVERTRWRW